MTIIVRLQTGRQAMNFLARSVLFITMLTSSIATAASIPFPRHVLQAIIGVLERENVSLTADNNLEFIRYSLDGKLEHFECSKASAFNFNFFHSSMGGGIRVGECLKDAKLNENMAEQQRKGSNAAIATLRADAAQSNLRIDAEAILNSQVVRNGNMLFVHVNTWSIFSSVETLLMIPDGSKTVILIQGMLPEAACLRPEEIDFCRDFRGTMRDVAQKVAMNLAIKDVPVPPKIEPLLPGRRTICDAIVHVIIEAIEQSEGNRISIVETIRYKQHATSPEIQADMRSASTYRAKGMSAIGAARIVGEECIRKHFKP